MGPPDKPGDDELEEGVECAPGILRLKPHGIVLARGEDAIARFDVDGDGPLQILRIGARLTAVVGRDPTPTQQG
jgi:hypothetical protein